MNAIRSLEEFFKRVIIPVLGAMGVGYEEFSGDVNTSLLVTYIAMMGLGIPAVVDYFKNRGGGNG
ncbi:MAG: hypothetical protein OJJ55_19065 [Rhodococcus sp.]|nr:hypothetical protein [Rhodococcus sp. (in: high G+C Gram-positive bacteria)]